MFSFVISIYELKKKFVFFIFSEYAEEAKKQSKVFQEVAKEKIGEVAEETLKSMLY